MNNQRYILLVEDDPDDLFIFSQAMEAIDTNIAIIETHDGFEALEYLKKAAAQQHLPCLIVLDLNMPGLNGKDTLNHLQADQVLQTVPVVVFTTSNSRADEQFCKDRGIDYFVKPLHFNELIKTVTQLVGYCDPAA